MILRTHQTLFGRWKVCSIGHTEGDETWLATFRYEQDAKNYVRARCPTHDAHRINRPLEPVGVMLAAEDADFVTVTSSTANAMIDSASAELTKRIAKEIEEIHIAAQGGQVAEPAHHSEKPDVGSCIGATVGATRESKGTRDL